jgi:hypothetical protein
VDDKGGINRGLIELDIRRGGLIFLFLFFVALKEDL